MKIVLLVFRFHRFGDSAFFPHKEFLSLEPSIWILSEYVTKSFCTGCSKFGDKVGFFSDIYPSFQCELEKTSKPESHTSQLLRV